MATILRLTVITGPHRGQKFCFRGPVGCTAGRSPDCFVQLSGDQRDETISRHHCHLDVHAPLIWVRDLNSKNGTFINGAAVRAGVRGVAETVHCPDPACPEDILRNGDILTMGGTSFQVDVVDCPPASNAADPPIWNPGEVAKKHCPIRC